jgi:hypothetical protein
MRSLAVLAMFALLISSPVDADNELGSLAIHLVASNAYLQCQDLWSPNLDCQDINPDLSVADLVASGGYGHAAFVAYNVDGVSGMEFYVTGWPVGIGTPDFQGPFYCAGEDVIVLGEPFEKRGGEGGIVMFPCEQPCSGAFCFCMISFGPEIYDSLPITISYASSQYSYPPPQSHNWFLDCPGWVEDVVLYEHDAVIGGECDPIPNCLPGPSPTGSDTWGTIKNLYR